MSDPTGPKQRRRGSGQPFAPGQSGNPRGRPAGARNRVTALAQRLMNADAEPVILALIEAAKAGDVAAIKLVLERVAPLPRNRPVRFTVPAINTPADLGGAMSAMLQAVAAGELAPDEAVSIASLIETRRRTIETLELDARIAALEQGRVAMRAIEQRVAKLEQAVSTGTSFHVWAEADETAEQAIARQFPDGLAHNATVNVYCWADAPTLSDVTDRGWQ